MTLLQENIPKAAKDSFVGGRREALIPVNGMLHSGWVPTVTRVVLTGTH